MATMVAACNRVTVSMQKKLGGVVAAGLGEFPETNHSDQIICLQTDMHEKVAFGNQLKQRCIVRSHLASHLCVLSHLMSLSILLRLATR